MGTDRKSLQLQHFERLYDTSFLKRGKGWPGGDGTMENDWRKVPGNLKPEVVSSRCLCSLCAGAGECTGACQVTKPWRCKVRLNMHVDRTPDAETAMSALHRTCDECGVRFNAAADHVCIISMMKAAGLDPALIANSERARETVTDAAVARAMAAEDEHRHSSREERVRAMLKAALG